MLRLRLRTVLVLLGGSFLVIWCATPVSFWEVLGEPWKVLHNSGVILESTLLDVSEDSEPLFNASRKLLKPFGVLRLDKIVKNDDAHR